MYRQHFAFTRYPFEASLAADELFDSEAMGETKARLEHLLELRGIGLITGEAGCGKTTCCRQVMQQLPPGLYRPGLRVFNHRQRTRCPELPRPRTRTARTATACHTMARASQRNHSPDPTAATTAGADLR